MDSVDEYIPYMWEKAKIVEGFDPNLFRKDACGAWIRRDMFGIESNMYGWNADIIFPLIMGGSVRLENVRALNCRNINSKGNDYPSYHAVYTSDGIKNITTSRYLVINEKTRTILKSIYENA